MYRPSESSESAGHGQSDIRRRLTEADLISGLIALDEYGRTGPPTVLVPHLSEPPSDTRDRILRDVEPSDLSVAAAPLWSRARALREQSRPIAWTSLLAGAPLESKRFAAWAEEYGMGVAYQTIPAARRIVAYASGVANYHEAQDAAAEALDQIQQAFLGVSVG